MSVYWLRVALVALAAAVLTTFATAVHQWFWVTISYLVVVLAVDLATSDRVQWSYDYWLRWLTHGLVVGAVSVSFVAWLLNGYSVAPAFLVVLAQTLVAAVAAPALMNWLVELAKRQEQSTKPESVSESAQVQRPRAAA